MLVTAVISLVIAIKVASKVSLRRKAKSKKDRITRSRRKYSIVVSFLYMCIRNDFSLKFKTRQ